MSDLQRLTGLHCVLEALRARRRPLHRLLIRAGRRRPELEAVVKAAAEAGVPVVESDSDALRRSDRTGLNPQGVILEAGSLPSLELAELCSSIHNERQISPQSSTQGSSRFPVRLVALDGVEDPQNVGAIARVAEASGVQGLVLTSRRAPPLSPALARASAGAIEWLPVARVTNLLRAIKQLKSQGFWVVGATPEAPRSLFEAPDSLLQGDLLVVLGAEGRGLRPSIEASVDHPLRIPTLGRVGSLNVAAAAAVVLFELARRSTHPPPPRDGSGEAHPETR